MTNTRQARDNEARPARDALTWLSLCALWAVLPLLPHLPIWISLLFACLLTWRYVSEHHGWPLPNRVLRLTMALSATVAVYKSYGALLGRDASIGLLVILL